MKFSLYFLFFFNLLSSFIVFPLIPGTYFEFLEKLQRNVVVLRDRGVVVESFWIAGVSQLNLASSIFHFFIFYFTPWFNTLFLQNQSFVKLNELPHLILQTLNVTLIVMLKDPDISNVLRVLSLKLWTDNELPWNWFVFSFRNHSKTGIFLWLSPFRKVFHDFSLLNLVNLIQPVRQSLYNLLVSLFSQILPLGDLYFLKRGIRFDCYLWLHCLYFHWSSTWVIVFRFVFLIDKRPLSPTGMTFLTWFSGVLHTNFKIIRSWLKGDHWSCKL